MERSDRAKRQTDFRGDAGIFRRGDFDYRVFDGRWLLHEAVERMAHGAGHILHIPCHVGEGVGKTDIYGQSVTHAGRESAESDSAGARFTRLILGVTPTRIAPVP